MIYTENRNSNMNVIVTGASSGIGRALAVTFAMKGHAVLAVARREDRLATLCREMAEQHEARVCYLALDITTPGAPQALFEEALRVFGKAHVLINNAGMSPYQEFHELSYRHMCQILALNIRSLTELCYLFMPHMLAHGEPSHVVNVGSVGGYAPLPKFSVYTGSKHYIRVFTNLLSYEYRGTNIRVSALHPGGVLTEFPSLAGQQIKKFAYKAMTTPEQLAEMAYPDILKGKRVIVPGVVNKIAVLMGKLLPFPWAIRMMEFVYDQSMDQTLPTYPP
ncbi:MAG: SDR family NAD(P)-dependent oxidoreductase [Methanothrix sp.]|nr:SDR family NAD(P)-dependent oxidoreductase [Methanothrix sp.]